MTIFVTLLKKLKVLKIRIILNFMNYFNIRKALMIKIKD